MKLNVIENFTKDTVITPNTIIKGDCLEVMKNIEKGSIDLVLTDLPYGTTACKWDCVIDFDSVWRELKRFRNNNTPIVLFGSEPFSSHLRMSNIKEYKYDWVWNKKRISNPFLAKKMPLKNIELLSVFYKKAPLYNPQKIKKNTIGRISKKSTDHKTDSFTTKLKSNDNKNEYGYPKMLIDHIPVMNNLSKDKSGFHPTQKPVALLEYLIKTYTNEGDTVLDFTSGSFSTAIACINTNRKFIGIEKDEKYFEIGKNRIIERLNELK